MIVPYSRRPTDTVGRVVAERMRAELGQSMVLGMSPAGGIGLGAARFAPDATPSTSATGAPTSSTARSIPFSTIARRFRADRCCERRSAEGNKRRSESFIAWLKATRLAAAGTAGIGSPHIGGVFRHDRHHI